MNSLTLEGEEVPQWTNATHKGTDRAQTGQNRATHLINQNGQQLGSQTAFRQGTLTYSRIS